MCLVISQNFCVCIYTNAIQQHRNAANHSLRPTQQASAHVPSQTYTLSGCFVTKRFPYCKLQPLPNNPHHNSTIKLYAIVDTMNALIYVNMHSHGRCYVFSIIAKGLLLSHVARKALHYIEKRYTCGELLFCLTLCS